MHRTLKLECADEKRLASWARNFLWGLVILIPIAFINVSLGVTDGSVGPMLLAFLVVYGVYGPFLGASLSMGCCVIYFAKRASKIKADYNSCVRGLLLSILYLSWMGTVAIVT